MDADFGINTPEFLQKKVERLKTALDEANSLMDRQVKERDAARAQTEALRQENAKLKRELAEAAGRAPAKVEESVVAAVDPELERWLRERIATLESQLAKATAAATASPVPEESLPPRVERRATPQPQPPELQSGSHLQIPGPFVSQQVIRSALDRDEFVLFCQPVFGLQSERITQYELLLRLRDSDGRMIRPLGFLEPADHYGMMGEIDRWVVRQALELLERDPSHELRLEVNLAAQSLSDPELPALIEHQIGMTDLDPGRLILEVSENVAAANLDACQRLAKELRGLGCGFALDDFGSTFAAFRHLRDLPVNWLKIDGDLVVTATESRTSQLTIKSLVELAKGIGAETIAEYVSDDGTLEFLREQGVGYAQGYRIGRPRPVSEVLTARTAPMPPQITPSETI